MAGPAFGDELAAKGEIADLISAYALHVRLREADRCSDLFTHDVVFETWRTRPDDEAPYLDNRLEGRDAVLGYITRASQGAVRVCPMIHNLLIELNGREATSNCVMAAVTLPGGGEIVGEYRDAFRFEGRWRFSQRKYTILLERPAAGGATR